MIYPETEQTAAAVEKHYNDLDTYYRQLWGEHVHHGFFAHGHETVQQATENLIDLVSERAQVSSSTHLLDVGCGYGGTVRYLVKQKDATATALTVSKSQWQYARTIDPESTNPRYLLGDFLHNSLEAESYDAILSIESSEHMVDKPLFFNEVARLLKPGGRFVTCVWLAKNNPTDWEVKHLLEPICREGRLPSMGSEEDYRAMIADAGLKLLDYEDLSRQVRKTWAICARRASKRALFDRKLRQFLRDKNSTERVFALSLFRILAAYHKGSMRYGIFTVEKS